ncbi:hypothetical protein AB1Y20_011720 [Prymnesium parvum]|uniref:Cytochrome b5 heme-binding domain-containing protein n=1 Tax=Prymnesium parvum TaxID=97485 RepID=A0AB34IK77_PRYPA
MPLPSLRLSPRLSLLLLPLLTHAALSPSRLTRPAARPASAAAPRMLAPTPAPATEHSLLPALPRASPSPLPLRIDGQWYDLRPYADAHPGGRWLLEYACGRDVTALFHAIHLRDHSKAAAALLRLPTLAASSLPLPSRPGLGAAQLDAEAALQGEYVFSLSTPAPSAAPLPPIASPLRAELAAMLRRRFPTRGAAKATAAHWARTALAAAATAWCWAGWLRGDVALTLLLPAVHWALIAHTVHEATHGNLSEDPAVNFWAQFTAHPICFNVFVWIPQHLLSHHQYTNDHQHDVDVHHFAPALLSAAQADARGPAEGQRGFNQGWTFVWKAFLTTLGTSVLQPLRTLLDKPTPNFDANITPVPAAVSKRTLWLSVLPSLLVLLYPLVAFVPHAPLLGFFLEVWPWVGMSIIFTSMTQVSHVQAATQPRAAPPGGLDCWTKQQIHTSLDYSTDDRIVTALSAGLNAQSLHHAMPSVGCAHFADMYEEYQEICERHGVEIRKSRNVLTAVREMLEYIFENNDPQRTTKQEHRS